MTDALGGVTRYGFDEAGNKLTQTDALGRVTHWTYDALGRETSRTLPLGQVETFAYDEAGNRTSHTDSNGATHAFVHDIDTDRLVEERWADGVTIEYAYDALGRRVLASDEHGTRTFAYDRRDRLVQENKHDGSALSYGYDAVGNRTTLTVTADGTPSTTEYGFDALNRLSAVTEADGEVTRYTYDANGNQTGIAQANGTATETTFDALNRVTEITHRGTFGQTLARYAYTLDPTGRRTAITEDSGRSSRYTYDALYRLTSETIVDPVVGNRTSQTAYDAVGNRRSMTVDGVETLYTVDDNDRLLRAGTTDYTFDANGNTLSESTAGGITTSTYDSRNRLTARTDTTGRVDYAYDADGLRIGKSTAGGARTDYLVDTNRAYGQVLYERTGSVALEYTYGTDLIGLDTGLEEYRYHGDALGSTRLLSGSAGTVADDLRYDAWGETLAGGTVAENTYRYTGEQFDASVGGYYLRARYLQPSIGRFTQMDTHPGDRNAPLTLNKYGYVNADPANVTDPSGRFWIVEFRYCEQHSRRALLHADRRRRQPVGRSTELGRLQRTDSWDL